MIFMNLDAQLCETGATLHADICIVGAGVAGISLARELMATDLKVCLLESGGTATDTVTQALCAGENIGLPYYPLDTARVRVMGGSSVKWEVPIGGDRIGARLRPLDPIDFEYRDWVPYSGWPFSSSELNPYYNRAQVICGVDPVSFKVEDWEMGEFRPSLSRNSEDVETILYKFGERERFSTEYPKELEGSENTTVLLNASVLGIETSRAGDEVERIHVGTLSGKRFQVKARTYVLAAGGIETPRLLLLSNRQQSAGLGNQHDLVGRFFMEHLHLWAGMVVPDHPNTFATTTMYNDVKAIHGVAVIAKLALTREALRREKLLNQNVQLIPCLREDPFRYPRRKIKKASTSRMSLAGGVVAAGGGGFREVITGSRDLALRGIRQIRKKTFGLPKRAVYVLANMTEQIPNPDSRVILGEKLDAFGQRRVQLDWRITAQDINSIRRTQQVLGKALEQAGLGRFFQELLEDEPPRKTHGGYHHMGTTRMHSDPKQGVVDANCRVHGISNLYIAGPSVFPTGGYANPVLTVVALAVRLSDHLRRQFM
jgi:choline dehydrogenase-like flavoprotein